MSSWSTEAGTPSKYYPGSVIRAGLEAKMGEPGSFSQLVNNLIALLSKLWQKASIPSPRNLLLPSPSYLPSRVIYTN